MKVKAQAFVYGVNLKRIIQDTRAREQRMAKRTATKKRQQTDSTLRNVRAANKRIADLERRVKILEGRLEPGPFDPPAFVPDPGSVVE